MAVKKKNKVIAAFNMSALTDIIFLLLIFFMLTSSVVAPNALNLKLPGSSNARPAEASSIANVSIRSDGSYYFDGKRIDVANMEERFKRIGGSSKPTITISPAADAPIENLVEVMDLAMRSNVEAILATDVK